MANSSSNISQPICRESILNRFQEITGSNINDAIVYLEYYNWNLDDILNDYLNGVDFKPKSDPHPELGVFYHIDNSPQQVDDNSDLYYAELISLYGDNGSIDNESKQEKSKNIQKLEPIYHEKQRLMRCGLHSLNNLFQIQKLFTTEYLESIVKEFDKRTFFNDYRTLWFGKYDLRILIEAIQRHGFNVQQIDVYRRQSIADLPWDSYFGLLINLNRTHWFTIKSLNGIYYNLDSTFRKPLAIGNKNDLVQYLINLIRRTQVYLFVVSQQTM